MAVAQNSNAAPSLQMACTRHRFTVDEYHKMAENGVLTEDDRVELIRGVIIDMPPIGPEHAGSVDELGDLIRSLLGTAAIVRSQNPLILASGSAPEPDLAIVRRRNDYYRSGHPVAADVYFIIEVADSTLQYDRETKAPLYAEDSIPEYWIVNLVEDVIAVYRDPSPTGYRSLQTLSAGDVIRPLSFPDVEIGVSDVLPSRNAAE